VPRYIGYTCRVVSTEVHIFHKDFVDVGLYLSRSTESEGKLFRVQSPEVHCSWRPEDLVT